MANKKISEDTLLTAAASAVDDDYIPVIDASEAQAADRNKRMTLKELAKAVVQKSDAFAQFGSGAIATTVQDKDRRWYDVLDFVPLAEHAAIKGGTTTTDLTTYIQAALDALPSAGGELRLPPGTYPITDDILIRKSNVRLAGAGASVTTISIKTTWTAAPTSGTTVAAMLNLIHSDNTTGSEGVEIHNIEITGIRFLGIRPTADPDTAPKAISSVYAHNIYIHGNGFEEIAREVIWPAGTGIAPTSDWRVVNNHFKGCGVLSNSNGQSCVNFTVDDGIVANNTFKDVNWGISLYGRNNVAIGNSIVDFGRFGISIGEAANQGVGATISNNVISGSGNSTRGVRGIRLVGGSTGGAKRVTVTGNSVRLKAVAGMQQIVGITISDSTTGARNSIRVADNVVTIDIDSVAVTTTGISAKGNDSQAEISNNTVEFLNATNAVNHFGIQCSAGAGETKKTVVNNNKVIGADSTNSYGFDLSRTSTGVHILTALNNVTESGFHRYDGILYTANNVPLSFVSITGVAGDGFVSKPTDFAAETFSAYGDYASTTNYQRSVWKSAKTTLSAVSGATVTATNLIPDGAFLLGVTTRINTGLGVTNGTTGYAVGDAGDPNKWGDVVGTTAGTASGSTGFTVVGAAALYVAADSVIFTAAGGNFDGTGAIEVVAHYMICEAD